MNMNEVRANRASGLNVYKALLAILGPDRV